MAEGLGKMPWAWALNVTTARGPNPFRVGAEGRLRDASNSRLEQTHLPQAKGMNIYIYILHCTTLDDTMSYHTILYNTIPVLCYTIITVVCCDVPDLPENLVDLGRVFPEFSPVEGSGFRVFIKQA